MFRLAALAIIMALTGCSSGSDGTTESTAPLADNPSTTDGVDSVSDNSVQDTVSTTVVEPSAENEETPAAIEEEPVEIVVPPSESEETPGESVEQPSEVEETPEVIVEVAIPFQIDEAVPAVLESLVGYQSDQLAVLVDGLAHEVINGASDLGQSLSDGEFTTEDSRFGTVVTTIQRVRYNCASGGTVIREIGRLRLDDIDYTRTRNIDGYDFEQCLFTNQSGPLVTGNYVATGHLTIDTQSTSGPRFGNSDSSYDWDQFELQSPEGSSYELNGNSSTSSSNGAFANSFVEREANFDIYRKLESDAIVELLTDTSYRQSTEGSQAGVFNSIQIELTGTATGTITEGNHVLVQTDTLLEHTAAPNFPENFRPFTGQLSLTSSDGGFVTLIASPSLNNFDVFDNLALNWSGALSDGTLISRSEVLLDEYSAIALNCDFTRADDTEPFTCTVEGEQFVVP